MNFSNDITIQYLEKVYDDLQQEQLKLMNSVKSNNSNGIEDEKKHTTITRQITLINSINLNLIKLRNLKKKSQIE